jgi:hypothetical protein
MNDGSRFGQSTERNLCFEGLGGVLESCKMLIGDVGSLLKGSRMLSKPAAGVIELARCCSAFTVLGSVRDVKMVEAPIPFESGGDTKTNGSIRALVDFEAPGNCSGSFGTGHGSLSDLVLSVMTKRTCLLH